MTERVAAERRRSMPGVREDLLFDGAGSNGALAGFGQVSDVDVQVHRRPVPFVAPGHPVCLEQSWNQDFQVEAQIDSHPHQQCHS
jgi:hypothetical protein